MIVKSNGYLEEYYKQIMSGQIIAGQELKLELTKLMDEMLSEAYVYDTTDADVRIDFMENCVRLTKSPFYGKPMKLMLWQKAFISATYGFKMATDLVDRFRKILLLIARKNTKALALDTRIPTPTGDKCIKDIHVGDYVFDEMGKPVLVTGTSEIFKNRICYEITFEDGEKIIADENHRWTVQTKGSRKLIEYKPKSNRQRTAYDKIDSEGRFIVTTAEMVYDYFKLRRDGKGIEYKYRVPMGKPLEYSEAMIQQLCLKSPLIQNEILKFAVKTENFIKRKKND